MKRLDLLALAVSLATSAVLVLTGIALFLHSVSGLGGGGSP